MMSEEQPFSRLAWRRIEIQDDQESHGGWWRELGEQVHLESVYGNANAHVRGRSPAELAEELLLGLVKRDRASGR